MIKNPMIEVATVFVSNLSTTRKDFEIAQEIIALAEKNIKLDANGRSYSGVNASAFYALDDAKSMLRLHQYASCSQRAICSIRYVCGIAHPEYHYAKMLASQMSWADKLYNI